MSRVFPISVGQKVWMSPVGYRARSWDRKSLIEGVVTKIARVYIYVDHGGRQKQFHKDTLECKDKYAGYYLWESQEQFHDYMSAKQELKKLRDFIDRSDQNAMWWKPIDTKLVHELYGVFEKMEK